MCGGYGRTRQSGRCASSVPPMRGALLRGAVQCSATSHSVTQVGGRVAGEHAAAERPCVAAHTMVGYARVVSCVWLGRWYERDARPSEP